MVLRFLFTNCEDHILYALRNRFLNREFQSESTDKVLEVRFRKTARSVCGIRLAVLI